MVLFNRSKLVIQNQEVLIIRYIYDKSQLNFIKKTIKTQATLAPITWGNVRLNPQLAPDPAAIILTGPGEIAPIKAKIDIDTITEIIGLFVINNNVYFTPKCIA